MFGKIMLLGDGFWDLENYNEVKVQRRLSGFEQKFHEKR
jgi:hypothetical protein